MVSIHPVLGNQKTAPSQTVEQDLISQLPCLRVEPSTRKEKLRSRQHQKQHRRYCKPAHAHHILHDLNMKVHTQSPTTKKRRQQLTSLASISSALIVASSQTPSPLAGQSHLQQPRADQKQRNNSLRVGAKTREKGNIEKKNLARQTCVTIKARVGPIFVLSPRSLSM